MAVAPIAGIVAKRHVEPGEKVAFDTPMITVVDLRTLELQAMVPTGDVPELKIGMAVELTVDGFDRPFNGRIERINPATAAGTRAIIVYVAIANADAALKSGMFATGRIALAAAAPVPTLPLTAVRSEGGQSFVWTVEDGRLVRHGVVVGRSDEAAGVIELKTMLSSALPVLVARFDNLKEGAPALLQKPAASAPPAATVPSAPATPKAS